MAFKMAWDKSKDDGGDGGADADTVRGIVASQTKAEWHHVVDLARRQCAWGVRDVT